MRKEIGRGKEELTVELTNVSARLVNPLQGKDSPFLQEAGLKLLHSMALVIEYTAPPPPTPLPKQQQKEF